MKLLPMLSAKLGNSKAFRRALGAMLALALSLAITVGFYLGNSPKGLIGIINNRETGLIKQIALYRLEQLLNANRIQDRIHRAKATVLCLTDHRMALKHFGSSQMMRASKPDASREDIYYAAYYLQQTGETQDALDQLAKAIKAPCTPNPENIMNLPLVYDEEVLTAKERWITQPAP